MDTLTAERLAEIKARCDAATEGPWGELCLAPHYHEGHRLITSEVNTRWTRGDRPNQGYREDNACVDNVGICEGRTHQEDIKPEQFHANMTFIAHARQDIPDLLAEIERLQVAVKWFEGHRRLTGEVATDDH